MSRATSTVAAAPLQTEAHAPSTGRADLAVAALGVLALLLIVAQVRGPARGLVTSVALVVVPGRALVRYLPMPHGFGRLALVAVLGAVVDTAAALAVLWLRLWHPAPLAVLILAVGSAALVLRARSAARRRGMPLLAAPSATLAGALRAALRAHPDHARPPVRRWAPEMLLAVALVLWAVSLGRLQVGHLGAWGLDAAFPLSWFAAFALVLGLCVFGLTGRVVGTYRMSLFTGALVLLVNATTVLAEDAPRYIYVYKHIGVTRFLDAHGAVNTSIDIYQRWPGFFAFTAFLGHVAGFGPVSYAAWAEPLFAAVDVVLVLALGRAVSRHARWYWTAAVLFTLTNWVGQNYFAPQAYAFTIYLTVCLLALTFLRGSPRRWGVHLEGRLGRLARAGALENLGRRPGPALLVGAVVAVVVLQAVISVSHQLTPYLVVFGLVPLFLAGYLRPRWLGLVMAVLPVVYLLPNLRFIQAHYGLFSGFDPVANATYSPVAASQLTSADVWNGHGSVVLSALTLLAAGGGWVRRLRTGRVRSAVLVGWLAVASGVSLGGQTYGGEGRQRVFLFALPWCALAASWLLWPTPEHGRGRRPAVALAVGLSLLGPLFVFTYFQPEAGNRVARAEVTSAERLYTLVRPGDAILLADQQYPTFLTANYDIVGPVTTVADGKRYFPGRLTAADAAQLLTGGKAGRGGLVVFSVGQSRYAELHRLFTPGELAGLQSAVAASPRFRLVYRDRVSAVYRLQPGAPTVAPSPSTGPAPTSPAPTTPAPPATPTPPTSPTSPAPSTPARSSPPATPRPSPPLLSPSPLLSAVPLAGRVLLSGATP